MSDGSQSNNSDSENDPEVQEIKISEIKDKILKQQKEKLVIKKKERKRKNKKKWKKNNVFDKYKEANKAEQLNEEEMQFLPLLLNQKKLRNVVNTDGSTKTRKMFIKNSKRLIIEDDDKSEEFDPVNENIIAFKTKHFFGNRINRCTNFITKI